MASKIKENLKKKQTWNEAHKTRWKSAKFETLGLARNAFSNGMVVKSLRLSAEIILLTINCCDQLLRLYVEIYRPCVRSQSKNHAVNLKQPQQQKRN